MAEKETLVPLQKALDENKEYTELLVGKNVSVSCVNRGAGKSKKLPFKALYENNNKFWLQGGQWEFFILEEDLAALREEVAKAKDKAFEGGGLAGGGVKGASGPVASFIEAKAPLAAPVVENGFGDEYKAIAALSPAEKVELLTENKKRLDSLFSQKPKDNRAITAALVDTTREAALANHAALLETLSLADDEAKKRTQGLVDSTRAMIESSTSLVASTVFDDELMTTLVQKSNGTIIQHMTRVYLNGTAFLSYYNKLISTSSIVNKFRIAFEKKYRAFYAPMFPQLDLEDITMERAFIGGMRAITQEEFFNWAVGFLLHDVGKAAAMEYHEGEAAYNREIVVAHVKVGCDSVMHKTNYPMEAGLITGCHHEYYGDPSGYGYFRDSLEVFRRARPYLKQNYCVSYEREPIQKCEALGYFPAKMLEMIDVYDSITDPNRKYRKALAPEAALTMMREEFVEQHHKIDIILFEIFSGFVREKLGK